MSLRIFILATVFTSVAQASEWKIDFSRRFQPDEKVEIVFPPDRNQSRRTPASAAPVQFVKEVLLENDPAPEIVILSTEKGFVPSSVQLKEGQAYRFHVVNVNEGQKNISFVMEPFHQHHATYNGQIRTFTIKPESSGVFRFSSPETAAMGKVVVSPKEEPPALRMPASE